MDFRRIKSYAFLIVIGMWKHIKQNIKSNEKGKNKQNIPSRAARVISCNLHFIRPKQLPLSVVKSELDNPLKKQYSMFCDLYIVYNLKRD